MFIELTSQISAPDFCPHAELKRPAVRTKVSYEFIGLKLLNL